jgi:hypothetical protein
MMEHTHDMVNAVCKVMARGGQTVFQLLGNAKGLLIKASILFGDDDRFSFKSAEDKGLVLSLAEAKGNIARELLNESYTGTQEAHLRKDGALINEGMCAADFECLQFTLEQLKQGRERVRAAGSAVTGKKLGKFSYFCCICGKRFTFPINDLLSHSRLGHSADHRAHEILLASRRVAAQQQQLQLQLQQREAAASLVLPGGMKDVSQDAAMAVPWSSGHSGLQPPAGAAAGAGEVGEDER